MTHTELVERQQVFHRAMQKRTAPVLVILLLAILGVNYFDGLDVHRWGYWLEAAAFAALVCILAAVTILFPRLKERQLRKTGLACPSCGEPLLDMTGRIAVVTGRCGACGHQVVEPG
jgi:cytochrome bd-type quinol oxidase subunit 2